jgi:hypothetical protein
MRYQEPQSSVIFTISPDTPFGSYTPNMIPFKDSKLGIHFETEEMMEDTVFLLRFNCPDTTCDYIAATGWGDLKLHVRGVHGKQMWSVQTTSFTNFITKTLPVIFAFVIRKYFHMSMRFTHRMSFRFTFRPWVAAISIASLFLQNKSREGFILYVNFAATASLVVTKFTHICANDMKSALCASGPISETNSKFI